MKKLKIGTTFYHKEIFLTKTERRMPNKYFKQEKFSGFRVTR